MVDFILKWLNRRLVSWLFIIIHIFSLLVDFLTFNKYFMHLRSVGWECDILERINYLQEV